MALSSKYLTHHNLKKAFLRCIQERAFNLHVLDCALWKTLNCERIRLQVFSKTNVCDHGFLASRIPVEPPNQFHWNSNMTLILWQRCANKLFSLIPFPVSEQLSLTSQYLSSESKYCKEYEFGVQDNNYLKRKKKSRTCLMQKRDELFGKNL